MKIVFLNPSFLPRYSRSQRSPAVTKSGTLYYPLWLSYAAGLMEQAGFEVKLIDAPADGHSHQQTLKIVKEFSPELLVMDTSTPSIYNDTGLAEKIKESLPECFIVLVGPHVSVLPGESLKLAPRVDAVARGEYDLTVLELAQAIKKNNFACEKILGLSYKKSGQIIHNPDRALITDLDQLPLVSEVYKKHLNIKNYFFAASLYPEVQILTARGCPFRCFFCLWPQTFQGPIYRRRSPQNVLAEFIYIKNNLPEVKGIVIEDDTFTVDKKRTLEICDLLIKNKLKLEWNANVRTDLDLETMQKMKEAGCYLIIAGIESTSQDILDNINKGLKTSDMYNFFANAKRAKLLVHAAFMAGNPGETRESLARNLTLAKKFLPDTLQFFPITPYPGTQAYLWAKENNYLKIDSFRDYLTEEGLHNCVIDLPGLSRQELVKWCDLSRKLFYLSPEYLLYKSKQLLHRPQDIARTLKTLCTFIKYLLRKPGVEPLFRPKGRGYLPEAKI